MSNFVVDWHPEKVIKEALDELQENAELVGKFVESDARRRLYAITDPYWGRAYRQQVVGRDLTSVVTRTDKEIVVTVGVKKRGRKGEYRGFYIEFGTAPGRFRLGKKRRPGRAAHPWLRPAVFENAKTIVALFGGE